MIATAASRLIAPLLCVALAACVAHAPRTSDAALSAAIRAQADAWDAAIVRKDRDTIAANMHDDFMAIDSNGEAADKIRFLEEITDPKLVIDPYEVEDFRVRAHGDVLITTGTAQMTGQYDGKTFASHYRYTDTYIRDGDRWKVVQVQTTRIKPAP